MKIAILAAAAFLSSTAFAQTLDPMTAHHHQAGHQAGHQSGAPAAPAGVVPVLPGQDAFGAIQEIVRILDSDPATDWSRVDIEALRRHLIDMNDVILHAQTEPQPVEGGLRIAVTGTGRTLDAIRRMVVAHAHELGGQSGWTARTDPLEDGVLLTVTSTDPHQAARIRGLGFAGIMAEGSHHQAHHLAMARGEPVH